MRNMRLCFKIWNQTFNALLCGGNFIFFMIQFNDHIKDPVNLINLIVTWIIFQSIYWPYKKYKVDSKNQRISFDSQF